MFYTENRKEVSTGMILRCIRKNGTMGIPLEIFFSLGGYHLHAIMPYPKYLNSSYSAKNIKEAIYLFQNTQTPGENLNFDTVVYVRNL
jgi:hypothetical protein